MKANLTIIPSPVGSHPEGRFRVVEIKEVASISIETRGHRVSIFCRPDEWGGEVKDISVSVEKIVKEPKVPKGLKILGVFKSKEIEIPEILADQASKLAKLKKRYELAKKQFATQHLGTIRTLVGPLKTSKGEQRIGGKKPLLKETKP